MTSANHVEVTSQNHNCEKSQLSKNSKKELRGEELFEQRLLLESQKLPSSPMVMTMALNLDSGLAYSLTLITLQCSVPGSHSGGKPDRHWENIWNSTQVVIWAQDQSEDPGVVRQQHYLPNHCCATLIFLKYFNTFYCFGLQLHFVQISMISGRILFLTHSVWGI